MAFLLPLIVIVMEVTHSGLRLKFSVLERDLSVPKQLPQMGRGNMKPFGCLLECQKGLLLCRIMRCAHRILALMDWRIEHYQLRRQFLTTDCVQQKLAWRVQDNPASGSTINGSNAAGQSRSIPIPNRRFFSRHGRATEYIQGKQLSIFNYSFAC